MATILVTGCAGYIGSVLCQDLLANGCDVVGVDALIYKNGQALLPLLGHPRFKFVQQDVRNTGELYNRYGHQADIIIPLAAIVGAPACDARPIAAQQINRDAIADLCDWMSPSQWLIYPNTNSGYGQTDGSNPCVETDPLTPVSLYGCTKCQAEQHVLDHHERSTVFRLATVFGASPRMRMDLMVNDFTRSLCRRLKLSKFGMTNPFEIYEPHFKRNFVHVRDVSRAIQFCIAGVLDNRSLPGVFNLGLPNANLTKLELAHEICRIIGLASSVVVESSGEDPDKRNYVVSNDKILSAGFRFENSLQQGIREVSQICQAMDDVQMRTMNNVHAPRWEPDEIDVLDRWTPEEHPTA